MSPDQTHRLLNFNVDLFVRILLDIGITDLVFMPLILFI